MGHTRLRGPTFGEMFIKGNAVATVINTQNVVHALKLLGLGHSRNVNFVAGITGTTSAFADYGATVTGTVKATDTGHGLETDDVITIEAGANYAGVHKITKIDDDEFYFTDTWVADDGAQPWTRGDYFLVNSKIEYDFSLILTLSPGTNNTALFVEFYVDDVAVDHFVGEHTFKLTTEVEQISVYGVDPVLAGKKIWIGITNLSNTGNPTIKHTNFTLQAKRD